MSELASEVLELLKDGRFHDLAEIAERLEAPLELVRATADFLAKHGHADYDRKRKAIRLKPSFLELLS